MLTKEQIDEVREHLEKAQNPVFLYDNDADGLCSFLILRRALGRGKGVAVRSYPELNAKYIAKVKQLKADYVFILDKPVVSSEFLKEVYELAIPLVWIDHHSVSERFVKNEFPKYNNFYCYNNSFGKKGEFGEPVSYMAYKILGRKEDLWIAVMGCIADHYLPDFVSEFKEKYPEFWGKVSESDPFDAYYKTEIGKIAIALNFGIKDSVSHVVELQEFLISCRNPSEVFLESKENNNFIEKYKETKKKYDALLERAKENISGKVIFFEYSGELSISSDLSNQLSFLYPDKYIAVAYKNGAITNISMRGKNVAETLKKILPQLEGASGGGHKDAVGARVKSSEITKFKELFGALV